MHLLAVACVLLTLASGCLQEWQEPYFVPDESVVVKHSIEGTNHTLEFLEEIEVGTILGNFTYDGDLSQLPSASGSDYRPFKVEELDNKWVLKTTDRLDYETYTVLYYRITKKSLRLDFNMILININDLPFTILPDKQSCSMDEAQPPNFTTECTYTVRDDDGIDPSFEFVFDEPKRFKMDKTTNDIVTKKEAKLTLVSLQEEDFDKGRVIPIMLNARDSRPNSTDVTIPILLNITDIPNKPPEWTPQLGSINIDEEAAISAIKINVQDGDYDVNWPIDCKLDCTGEICSNIIVHENCTMDIKGIILNEPNNNIVQLKIFAKDRNPENPDDSRSMETNQTVYLIIEDINNFDPVITISKDNLAIEEGSVDKLEIDIQVNDNDSNDNGRYNVFLNSSLSDGLDINDIMQIVPNTGYQKANVSILIKTATKLNYDDPLMPSSFNVTIQTVDVLNERRDEKQFRIDLIDINDEVPIWTQQEGYTINIKETFGRDRTKLEFPLPTIGEEQSKFYAEDADKEPAFNTITYSIVGSSANNLLKLKNPQPIPNENLVLVLNNESSKQPFDFEREPKVFITIQASDGKHTVPIQVTIELEDINDEMPSITATTHTMDILENVTDPRAITIKVTGLDADNNRLLNYSINTKTSYVSSRGRRADWNNCITIDETPNDGNPAEFTLAHNLLNYQSFDTINLQVLVQDMNGEDPKKQITTLPYIIITITNVQNLPLVFDTTSLEGYVVVEKTKVGERIMVIKAIDQDLPSDWGNITYSLLPTADREFVTIDPDTGILTVAKDSIDADPDKFSLNLRVRAEAGIMHEDADFTVEIRDTNDKRPSAGQEKYNQTIKEYAKDFGEKFIINVTDGDREFIFFSFMCSTKDLTEIYTIEAIPLDGSFEERQIGCSVSIKNSTEIKRKEGISKHEIKIRISNHKDTLMDVYTETTVIVDIQDINDKQPSIRTDMKPIEVDENIKQGTELGVILGSDEDFDTNNIYIKYTLVSVEREPDEMENAASLTSSDFDVETDDIEVRNAKLSVKKDLENYHGTYTLTFHANNTRADELQETSNNNITLVVKKYNFKPVIFTNILDSYTLRADQEINTALFLFGNEKMKDFVADDQQGGKFSIKFVLAHQYFYVKEIDGRSTVQLQLTKLPPAGTYKTVLNLEAQINEETDKPAAKKNITVWIIGDDSVPIFDENTTICNFPEATTANLDCKLPEARKPDDADELRIRYYVHESEPKNAYVIEDPLNLMVSVVTPIDLLDLVNSLTWFTVEASYQVSASSGSIDPANPNLLNVTVVLEDVNNHPPVFVPNKKVDTLLDEMRSDTYSISLAAHDDDTTDTLTYTIETDTYKTTGDNLPPWSAEPFEVVVTNTRQAALMLKFDVVSTMSGQIELDVRVTDTPVGIHGPTHAFLHIQLDVIAKKNIVLFIFKNKLEDIDGQRSTIERVFAKHFECLVGIQKTAQGEDMDGETTEVSAYFLDTATHAGIAKGVIETRIMDYDFEARLQTDLRAEKLFLRGVKRDVVERESLEETYEIALIAVCCIFALLTAGLIGFFTWKIRATNARLRKVDHAAEVRRPTTVANLPGANRRATQVVNPNISQERGDDYDDDGSELSFTHSKRSLEDDDEDFVGVENNDIFKIAKNN